MSTLAEAHDRLSKWIMNLNVSDDEKSEGLARVGVLLVSFSDAIGVLRTKKE